MPKIIHSPIECGYRVANACLHDRPNCISVSPCKSEGENNFPEDCPLEDAIRPKDIHLDKDFKACIHCEFKPANCATCPLIL